MVAEANRCGYDYYLSNASFPDIRTAYVLSHFFVLTPSPSGKEIKGVGGRELQRSSALREQVWRPLAAIPPAHHRGRGGCTCNAARRSVCDPHGGVGVTGDEARVGRLAVDVVAPLQPVQGVPPAQLARRRGGGGALILDFLAKMLPGTSTTLSRMRVLLPRGTPSCPVCLDNVPSVPQIVLSRCGHTFCEPCLAAYLTERISCRTTVFRCFSASPPARMSSAASDTPRHIRRTGMPPPARAPHPARHLRNCGTVIADEDVWFALGSNEALLDRLSRYRAEAADPLAVACPHCGVVQISQGATAPSMVCSACSAPFCFTHGNAHTGSSCAAFESAAATTEGESAAALARDIAAGIYKRCPGCSTLRLTFRTQGCNHMTCSLPACRVHWCWLCSRAIASVRGHFAVGGCPQFGTLQEAAAREQEAGGDDPWRNLDGLAWNIAYIPPRRPLLFRAGRAVCLAVRQLRWRHLCRPDEARAAVFPHALGVEHGMLHNPLALVVVQEPLPREVLLEAGEGACGGTANASPTPMLMLEDGVV